MRKVLVILAIVFSCVTMTSVEARSYQTKSSDVWVDGYTRKNGTYVPGYWRSAPDNSILNNYGCIDNNVCGGNSNGNSSSTSTSSSTTKNSIETAKRSYNEGKKALERKDYAEALNHFITSHRWNSNDTSIKSDLMKTYMIMIKKSLADKKLGSLLNYIDEAQKIEGSNDIAAYRALYHLANSNCTTFDTYMKLIKGSVSSEVQILLDAGKAKCATTTASTGDTTIIVNPQNSKALRKLKAAQERANTRFKGLYTK